MKTITLRADESLIAAARARAHAEGSTLNEQFRRWLASYAKADERMERYEAVMRDVRGKVEVGVKIGRNAMNER